MSDTPADTAIPPVATPTTVRRPRRPAVRTRAEAADEAILSGPQLQEKMVNDSVKAARVATAVATMGISA